MRPVADPRRRPRPEVPSACARQGDGVESSIATTGVVTPVSTADRAGHCRGGPPVLLAAILLAAVLAGSAADGRSTLTTAFADGAPTATLTFEAAGGLTDAAELAVPVGATIDDLALSLEGLPHASEQAVVLNGTTPLAPGTQAATLKWDATGWTPEPPLWNLSDELAVGLLVNVSAGAALPNGTGET